MYYFRFLYALQVGERMSNEVAIRFVLDQLANEGNIKVFHWREWAYVKGQMHPDFVKEFERAVELGFEAGQKQKETEVKEAIDSYRSDKLKEMLNQNENKQFGNGVLVSLEELVKRLFSEGGEKKDG